MKRSEARQEYQDELLELPVHLMRFWVLGNPGPQNAYRAVQESTYRKLLDRVKVAHRVKIVAPVEEL